MSKLTLTAAGLLAALGAGVCPAAGATARRSAMNLVRKTAGLWLVVLGMGTAGADTLTPGDFNYGMQITFTNTPASPLSNFPALVVFSNNWHGFQYSQAASDGRDLRFTRADGTTTINHEIDFWGSNTQVSTVWVQVPELTNGTTIWAYWGNAGASLPVYATNGATWTNGYRGVWHLSSTNALDSTARNHDGTSTANTNAAGIVDGAQGFNAGNTKITVPYSSDFDLTGNFTVYGWCRINSGDAGDYRTLTAKDQGASNRNWWLTVKTGGVVWWRSTVSSGNEINLTTTATVHDGKWHFVAAVHDSAKARIYIDGVEKATSANVPGVQSTGGSCPVYFAMENNDTGRSFKGGLDEFRIASMPRESNWLWACYMTVASNETVTTYGSAGPTVAGVPAVNVTNGAAGITASGAWLQGTLTSTGDSPAQVWSVWGTNDNGATSLAAWGSNTNAFGYVPIGSYSNQTSLDADTHYGYRFYAQNDTKSNWSALAGFDTAIAAAPVIQSAIAQSRSAIELTWSDAFRTETGFVVQYTNVDGSASVVVGAGSTDRVLTGLVPSTLYALRVAATNAVGLGPWSAWTNASTAAAGPALVHEPFCYPLGSNIVGLAGGVGWPLNRKWDAGALGAPGSAALSISNVNGLTFSDYPAAGNALRVYQANGGNWYGAEVRRRIGAVAPTGSDLWSSCLWRLSSLPGSNLECQFGAGNAVSFMRSAYNDTKVAVSYAGTKVTHAATSLSLNTPYLVVSRFANVNGSGGGSGTVWFLTAANYDAIKTGGVSVSELDANCAAKVTASSGTSPTLTAASDALIYHYRNSGACDYIMDELRFGEYLEQVVPIPGANTYPGAVDDMAATSVNTPIMIAVLANDFDVDADTLSVAGVTQPANGTVTFTSANVTYTPPANWNGTAVFTYTLLDGRGLTATGTLRVVVQPAVESTLFLYEGFDYPRGSNIVGQAGGYGWRANPWAQAGWGSAAWSTWSATNAAPLAFSDYPNAGNALRWYSTGGNWPRGGIMRRVGTAPAAGSTTWLSYLFKVETFNNSDFHVDICSVEASDSGWLQSMPKRVWNANPAGVGYDTSSANATGAALNDGNTYLIVTRFTNVGGAGGGTATSWALSAANYNASKSGGITEDKLDANNTAKATHTSSTQTSLLDTHYLRIWAADGSPAGFVIDELKYGLSLRGVTITPPPAGSVLLLR